jgi:hypothetical protein
LYAYFFNFNNCPAGTWTFDYWNGGAWVVIDSGAFTTPGAKYDADTTYVINANASKFRFYVETGMAGCMTWFYGYTLSAIYSYTGTDILTTDTTDELLENSWQASHLSLPKGLRVWR